MKLLASIIFLTTLLPITFGQSKTASEQPQSVSDEFNDVLTRASTLGPEFSADVSLRMISAGLISDKARKKQILEEAFYASFNAVEKAPRKVLPFEGQVVTFRPTFQANSYVHGLDRLSLQIRIVSEMLNVDRRRALELFNEIKPDLTLSSLACTDYLLYDLGRFYNLVGKIAEVSFTTEAIKQNDRALYLGRFVEGMRSPAQIPPIIKMLSSLDLDDCEKQYVVGIFNKSLRKIQGDDRSFSFETLSGPAFDGLHTFARSFARDSTLYDDFRNAFKEYLSKNLQGERCSDNVNLENRRASVRDRGVNQAVQKEKKPPYYIHDANRAFYSFDPISVDELKPSKIVQVVFPEEYFSKGDPREALQKIRALQVPQVGDMEPDFRATTKWEEAFASALEKVSDLDGTKDEIDLFHQKCQLLLLLFREAPKIALKEKVVNEYIKTLIAGNVLKNYPSEWFLQFNYLLNEITKGVPNDQKSVLFGIISNANNQSIRVYFDLQLLLNERRGNTTLKVQSHEN